MECKKCGAHNSDIYFITETQFGYGDSTHNCFVECKKCGNKSEKFGGFGLFNDKNLRLAQADFENQK